MPVARATNLTRTLCRPTARPGSSSSASTARPTTDLASVDLVTEPVVLVVGSEGKGLSRLVRETCDVVASIPIAAAAESLNAGVAAGIALYVTQRRRSEGRA